MMRSVRAILAIWLLVLPGLSACGQRTVDLGAGRAASQSRPLNFQIRELTVLADRGDGLDGKAELQLYVVASDGKPPARLVYPANGVVKVSVGETVFPGKFMIGVDLNSIGDELVVYVLAVDIDEQSPGEALATDLVLDLLVNAVLAAVSGGTSPTLAKLVKLGTSQLKSWARQADVIGEQAFVLTRSNGWSAGRHELDHTDDGGLRLLYEVYVADQPSTRPAAPTAQPDRAPSIAFWADQTELATGTCTVLHWDVEGASAVYLNGDGVRGHDDREVCPSESTRYTLRVEWPGGTTRRELTIDVRQPQEPSISFWVDRERISAGECTTLHWDVENAFAIYLNDEGMTGHGARSVCPSLTSRYSLRVEWLGGTSRREITIEVEQPQEPSISFWVDRERITAGECTTLHWDVQNSSRLYLNDESVGAEGQRQVCPRDTTIYTLHAEGPGGAARRDITVSVESGGADVVRQEAEAGIIESPMTIGMDSGASNEKFVHTPSPYGGNGQVTLRLTIPTDGEYEVWARVWGMGYGADSFFVKVDDGRKILFDIPLGAWTWALLMDREGPGTEKPVRYRFSGHSQHVVIFQARENEARLDAVELRRVK
jgi:hypothetical protein